MQKNILRQNFAAPTASTTKEIGEIGDSEQFQVKLLTVPNLPLLIGGRNPQSSPDGCWLRDEIRNRRLTVADGGAKSAVIA